MLTDDRLRELWKANGQPGTVWRDWAERFARAVEREALEEAALLSDEYAKRWRGEQAENAFERLSEEIRELKEK